MDVEITGPDGRARGPNLREFARRGRGTGELEQGGPCALFAFSRMATRRRPPCHAPSFAYSSPAPRHSMIRTRAASRPRGRDGSVLGISGALGFRGARAQDRHRSNPGASVREVSPARRRPSLPLGRGASRAARAAAKEEDEREGPLANHSSSREQTVERERERGAVRGESRE